MIKIGKFRGRHAKKILLLDVYHSMGIMNYICNGFLNFFLTKKKIAELALIFNFAGQR